MELRSSFAPNNTRNPCLIIVRQPCGMNYAPALQTRGFRVGVAQIIILVGSQFRVGPGLGMSSAKTITPRPPLPVWRAAGCCVPPAQLAGPPEESKAPPPRTRIQVL